MSTRLPTSVALVPMIGEALGHQAARMERAADNEKKRRAIAIESRKRSLPDSEATSSVAAKRPKLDSTVDPSGSFDFTGLPANLITELIIANLHHFSEPALNTLVQDYKQRIGLTDTVPVVPSTPPPVNGSPHKASTLPVERATTPVIPGPLVHPKPIKQEPVDPLKMDLDQDELEFEPDRLNDEVCLSYFVTLFPVFIFYCQLSGGTIQDEAEIRALTDAAASHDISLQDFKLPPPPSLAEAERLELINSTVFRISDSGQELRVASEDEARERAAGSTPAEMWVLLVLRMITRVADPSTEDAEPVQEEAMELSRESLHERQDKLRQKLLDFVMKDFSNR